MFQICMVPSLPVETICLLSGDQENDNNPVTSLVKSIPPVFASLIYILPFLLAEATFKPSGDQATLQTVLVCSLQVYILVPVPESHTCTVLSGPADTIYFPSGDQSRANTAPLWFEYLHDTDLLLTSQICTTPSSAPTATWRLSVDHATVCIFPE